MKPEAKKFDVYFADGKAKVYGRGEIPECGDLPDGEPLHVTDAEDGDWFEWCDAHSPKFDEDAIRVCKRKGNYPAEYAADLERKAQELFDSYRKRGAECGWGEVSIDHTDMNYTFRASAAWKEMPTMYTFYQPLKWSASGMMDFAKTEHLWARDCFVRLCGMADAAHELGLDIVFMADFKVKVVGLRAEWATRFEC